MSMLNTLEEILNAKFADVMTSCKIANQELTIEIPAEKIVQVGQILRDDVDLQFDTLVDVCGVDYLSYGVSNWETNSATATGFDRAVEAVEQEPVSTWTKPRYAVVYHLLSVKLNHRLRVRTFPVGEPPMLDSVISVWQSANWFERETFDLFGIIFNHHPDLRRILTDYGFVGHALRKDFPTSGNVEVRYDAEQGRVIYEPISIAPRVLVPRVIRDDNRYLNTVVVPEKVNG